MMMEIAKTVKVPTHKLLVTWLLCCIRVEHVLGTVQDLTHPFDDHVIGWPGDKPWTYHVSRDYFTSSNNQSIWLEANTLETSEHMGTHIDAPAHMYKGGHRLDEISLDRLMGPMAVIDTVKQAKEDRDYMLSIKDVENYEDKYGRIPDGAIVFMYNGWDEYWFAHNKGIGLDTLSLDHGQSPDFEAHRTAFARNVWGLENLANLGKVPAAGTTVHVMPINIWQASGGPSRVVAFWDTATGDAVLVKASILGMLMSICTYIYINMLY